MLEKTSPWLWVVRHCNRFEKISKSWFQQLSDTKQLIKSWKAPNSDDVLPHVPVAVSVYGSWRVWWLCIVVLPPWSWSWPAPRAGWCAAATSRTQAHPSTQDINGWINAEITQLMRKLRADIIISCDLYIQGCGSGSGSGIIIPDPDLTNIKFSLLKRGGGGTYR